MTDLQEVEKHRFGVPAPRQIGKVVSVANQTASGAIGTSAVVTDVRAILIAQTTAGLTLTLPNPSDASVVFGLDVINTGSASFTMYGNTVAAATTLRCVWTASAWEAASAGGANPPKYTVATLPTGVTAGTLAYATNGRAITGVGTLGGGFTTQAASAGTGCLVTYSGSVWQIAGTTTTVAA